MGNIKVAYLSTYPPFEDGIATFVHDLIEGQKTVYGDQTEIVVAAIDITGIPAENYGQEVKWVIPIQDRDAYSKTAEEINNDPDIKWVNIQHEYGIYGGDWGEHILTFLKVLKKPVVVTLHTILPRPPKTLRRVTQQLVNRAEKLVTLTLHSKVVLQKLYQVPEDKIQVIQHGIHPVVWVEPMAAKKKARLSNRLVLRTFGFLGRGKGIEYVLKALPRVTKKYPNLLYFVMGETHPLVKRHEGEKYREELVALAEKLGIKRNVRFVNKYLNVRELLEALKATDLYISTSLNPNQAVSGTFSYALGAGRAVVSTKFSQALEFIDEAVGVLVDIRKPVAYAKAILNLFGDDTRRERMHHRAYERTRNMLWTRVAVAYQKIYLGDSKWWPDSGLTIKHLLKMTDKRGLWQFAKYKSPDRRFGYTLDDNARAALFCVRALKLPNNGLPAGRLLKLLTAYVKFIKDCQQDNGMFINYIDENGMPGVIQNREENLGDANARTMWALGEIISSSDVPADIADLCKNMWAKRMANGWDTESIKSRAYLMKGLAAKGDEQQELNKQAEILADHYEQHRQGAWRWFSPIVSYANGILPEAMWLAFGKTGNPRWGEIAKESTEFLTDVSFRGEVFSPIGCRGWYSKEEQRADWDQQPEEVLSMIEALKSAFEITREEIYRELAAKAFLWWWGDNLLGVRVYDRKSGGSHDGLTENGLNPNQGAESTLAYLLSVLILERI